MRDLSHQAGRAVADAVTCYALGLILTPYSVHAADGTTLACLSCPIDAHQLMRTTPAAVEWRNAEGVVCGRKVRKQRRGEPGVFVLPTRSHRRRVA